MIESMVGRSQNNQEGWRRMSREIVVRDRADDNNFPITPMENAIVIVQSAVQSGDEIEIMRKDIGTNPSCNPVIGSCIGLQVLISS